MLVGVCRFVFGLVRAGSIVRLISLPVVTGFTSGAAILIISSQIPRSLGLDAGDGGVLAEAWSALTSVGDWDLAAIVLSVITAVLFLGGRKLSPLFPGVLVAVVIGIVWSRASQYRGETIGTIPEGIPPFDLNLPWGEIPTLLLGAIVIALVGFAEPVSIARTFANETGQKWDANREFMASGLANLVSAVTGGYPVGGSFSRSSINKLAGAQTRWSGGVTGLIVIAFLPFASVLEPLPRAVLSAIVISAVVSLVKPRRLLGIWKRSHSQAVLAWITFAATLAFAPRVERAVLLGVVLTVALHFGDKFTVERFNDEDTDEPVLLTPAGMMWMGTDRAFNDQLMNEGAESSTGVSIDFANAPFIDDATAQSLAKAAEAGADVTWKNPPDGSEAMLEQIQRQIDEWF